MPPKLTRSCSSFTTGMISGKSSRPFTKGYSIGSPKRRPNSRNRAGGEVLVAEEDHEVLEPGAPDGRDGVVGEILRQVDARDLGAERPGDGLDLDGRPHGGIIASAIR